MTRLKFGSLTMLSLALGLGLLGCTAPSGPSASVADACKIANAALDEAYPPGGPTEAEIDPKKTFERLRASYATLDGVFSSLENAEVKKAGLAQTRTAAAMSAVLEAGLDGKDELDLDKLAAAEAEAQAADEEFAQLCPVAP